ncbi:MAG: DegT/DnrJ/EryC1/StrS aminotransferase family protein [Candidatus Roizmanbacteria bacterium]|nr:MAG: DegT/DnrJ/EryC1/StrS aminotransferase family protein [Candidatus Roizmanbacteria bacterium]
MLWRLQENIIDQKNIKTLIDFIKSTERYTQFTKVKEFEEAWSKWQGRKYSVFVNSGSSANLIILDLLKDIYKWKAGDEIIVPTITWITDISSVLQLGLTPIFVDINLEDFSFNYQDLQSKINRKTKAIFLSHLIGFPADMKKVKKMIKGKNIAIIEDCCESHGATIDNIKVGNLGDVSSFSFYWGHHMTTVEGGMVSTDNEKIYKYALLKRSHGLARELPPKYHAYYKRRHKTIDFNFLFLTTGFNVRNTELSAVLGLSQLKKIDQYIKIRNANHKKFVNILKKYSDFFAIPYKDGISSFCLPFILKKASLKKPLQKFLTKKGIESRPFISGNLLKQPFLKKYSKLNGFPNADHIHSNAFYIGNNQFVNENRLELLDKTLSEFFDNNHD